MDENTKHGGGDGGAPKPTAENVVSGNPNSAAIVVDGNGAGDNAAIAAVESDAADASRQASSRTPFTNLSQVEADLALARTLQEQERAYMMLSMNGNGGNYGGWAEEYYYEDDNDHYDDPDGQGSDEIDEDQEDDDDDDDDNNDVIDLDDDDSEDDDTNEEDGLNDEDEDEDDGSDVHDSADSGEDESAAGEIDPAAFPDDEAYARALQDAEEREMAARLLAMAGINEREEDEDSEDHGGQDAWEEVDPDELSYEELVALGEVVGTESRGLSSDTIALLPSVNYKSENTQDAEPCVICRLEYEDDDTLTVLTCKHSYHSECISNWLKINRVCPVCSTEVSTSGKSS